MAERIVIIGGGFSGLACADLLEHALPSAEILILERAQRLGGRIRTTALGPGGPLIDVGAAELYDIAGAPQLRRLVARLGLPMRPLRATPTIFFDGQRIDDEDDLRAALGAAAVARLETFWAEVQRQRPAGAYARAGHPEDAGHPWSRCSFAKILAQIGNSAAERFTAMQVHSDAAASPERVTGLYGADNLLIDHLGYCRMFTIPGGNQRLIQRLAAATRCSRRLGVTVRSVESGGTRRLRLACDDGTREDVDAVIVSVPPTALREIEWPNAPVRDAIAAHIAHHDHGTGYLRVTVMAASRFWADELPDDYFVTDAFRGVTVYDQSPAPQSRHGPGILSWLLAGDPARRLSGRTDEEVVAAVLASAPPPLRGLARRVEVSRVDRWFGARGVSRRPGGPHALSYAQRHRPAPSAPTLLVTGDALYDATISGALDGAAQTVALLLHQLGRTTRPDASAVLRAAGLSTTADPAAPNRGTRSELPFLARSVSRR